MLAHASVALGHWTCGRARGLYRGGAAGSMDGAGHRRHLSRAAVACAVRSWIPGTLPRTRFCRVGCCH
jgi:hypothetical protein